MCWASVHHYRLHLIIHPSLDGPLINSKKAKKAANKNATASYTAIDFSDQAALNRRAQRFQREHELERTKHIRGTGQMKSTFSNGTRSGSPYPTNLDEPEGDPVKSGHLFVLIV